ncbi:alcohol dehydrogenase catalytic domain-containing protein [Streptomyces sp. NPDC018833]|uniref:alcohol dehydrogenase catalytic domain-containing protein n=1 Tax=Streptomyces sp. NPDC018833 TaxID=3365053 RepID=UPI0037B4B7DF
MVEELGDGFTHLAVGQRVAVPWLGWACGRCEHFLSGWETLCEQQVNTGYGVDGGYAERMLAHPGFAQPVPDDIDPREAAPLTCAGVTTCKALKVVGIGPADLVAISDIGGLGHLAVRYAKIAGAAVAAIDVSEGELRLAAGVGADILIDARKEEPAAVLQRHGGAHASSPGGERGDLRDSARLPAPWRQAGHGRPSHGREVLIFFTVLGGTSVIGSIVGTCQDLAEVLYLHAAGRTRVICETRPLSFVNECIDDVPKSHVKARALSSICEAAVRISRAALSPARATPRRGQPGSSFDSPGAKTRRSPWAAGKNLANDWR